MCSSSSDDDDDHRLEAQLARLRCSRPAPASPQQAARQSARLLALELGSLRAELGREAKRTARAVARAQQAEAAQRGAEQRVAELEFTTNKLEHDAAAARAAADASGRRLAQLRHSLAAAEEGMHARLEQGRQEVQQLLLLAARLQSDVAGGWQAAGSFGGSSPQRAAGAVGRLASDMLAGLQALEQLLCADWHGRPAEADHPSQCASPPRWQQQAASYAARHSAQEQQQREGREALQQLMQVAGLEADKLQLQEDKHRLEQELASAQRAAATVQSALHLLQGQHADTVQQLTSARAEAAGLRASLCSRDAPLARRQLDAAAAARLLSSQLASSPLLHEQQRQQQQQHGVELPLPAGGTAWQAYSSGRTSAAAASSSPIKAAVPAVSSPAKLASAVARASLASSPGRTAAVAAAAQACGSKRSPAAARCASSSPAKAGGPALRPLAAPAHFARPAVLRGGAAGAADAGRPTSPSLAAPARSPAHCSGSPTARYRALVLETDAALERLATCRRAAAAPAAVAHAGAGAAEPWPSPLVAGARPHTAGGCAAQRAGSPHSGSAAAAAAASPSGGPGHSRQAGTVPSPSARLRADLWALDDDIAKAEAALQAAAARLHGV